MRSFRRLSRTGRQEREKSAPNSGIVQAKSRHSPCKATPVPAARPVGTCPDVPGLWPGLLRSFSAAPALPGLDARLKKDPQKIELLLTFHHGIIFRICAVYYIHNITIILTLQKYAGDMSGASLHSAALPPRSAAPSVTVCEKGPQKSRQSPGKSRRAARRARGCPCRDFAGTFPDFARTLRALFSLLPAASS